MSDEKPSPRRRPPWRVLLVLGLIAALWVGGKLAGVGEYMSIEALRDAMQSAGWWGVAVFLVAFAVGELLHVFGVIFIVAAVLVYGQIGGGLLGYVGAVMSVTVSFVVVRGVGGQPLREIRWSYARRLLDRLEEQPIRVVTILRLLFWMFPPLNYALAMSNVKLRNYLVGSALGLLIPCALCAAFVDFAYNWLK